MDRTRRQNPVQAKTRVPHVRGKLPATSAKPAAILFVTGATSQIQPMNTWRSIATKWNQGSESLTSDDFEGDSKEELLDSLFVKASELRQESRVDGATYMVLTFHGAQTDEGYLLSVDLAGGRTVNIPADAVVSVLRQALGSKNPALLACCFGGHMHQGLANIEGDTFVLVGKKLGLSAAANNTIAQAIKVMGRNGPRESPISKAQLERVWERLKATTGENIAWIVDGEIRKHNALRALSHMEADDDTAQLKRVQVILAKIWHGSLKSFKHAIGAESLETLREQLAQQSCTPITFTLRNPEREVYPKIDYLIETMREDVNEIVKGTNGQSALHLVAHDGDAQTLLRLIHHGAEVLQGDGAHMLPLHRAILSGADAPAKIAILLHADPERLVDRKGTVFKSPALHIAIMRGNVEAVQTLLCCGADPASLCQYGQTPHVIARELRDLALGKRIMDLLDYFGADINRHDSTGYTALHTEAARGNAQEVQDLLDDGASFLMRDKWGALPIHRWAEGATFNNLGTLNVLQKAGADVNATDLAGRSALHYAVITDNLGTVIKLLMSGADPYLPDHLGILPIHQANQKLIKALQMQMEARPPGQPARTDPPLKLNRLAMTSTRASDMAYWVTLPGALERRDAQGQTALAAAIMNGNALAARYLFKKGAQPNIRLTDGRSLLQHAQAAKLDNMVELLFELGADPNW